MIELDLPPKSLSISPQLLAGSANARFGKTQFFLDALYLLFFPPDFACSRKVESIPLAHQGQTSRAGQTPSAASFRVIAAAVSIS